MANTQAVCNSFKKELLTGHHAFGTTITRGSTAKDTFKAALYFSSASIGAGTTVYTSAGEVTGTAYTAGGVDVTNGTDPALTGSVAHWTPSASIQYPTVTINSAPFNCVLIYNNAQANRAVAAYTFGDQTITGGTFTLTMPVNDGTTGLLRLA